MNELEEAGSKDVYKDLEELTEFLKDGVEILEDEVDKNELKEFVLPIIFYKAIHDKYQDVFDELVEEYGDETIAKDKDFHDYHVPDECSWENLLSTNRRIDKKINDILNTLEDANSEKLEGVFTTDYVDADIDNSVLRELVQHFDKKNLSTKWIDARVFSQAFRELVKDFADKEGRDPGEFFTPSGIIKIMVSMIAPFEDGDEFHDPACGSGDMLIEIANHYDKEQDEARHRLTYTGQEKIKNVPTMARINAYLNKQKLDVKAGDPLSNPQFTEDGNELKKFDYVLTNFPFGDDWAKNELKEDPYERFNWVDKLPRKDRADYAYIMHMVEQLKEDGMMASVVPQGVLFRKNEKKFRRYLIENDLVEAVIGLPEKLFGQDTGIAPAIILVNKDKPKERENKVFFLHAGDERFYRELSAQNELTEEGIDHIIGNYEGFTSEERVSRVVDEQEIEENDYNLNIALYVDTTEPEEEIDVKEEFDKLKTMEEELEEIKQTRDEHMGVLGYE